MFRFFGPTCGSGTVPRGCRLSDQASGSGRECTRTLLPSRRAITIQQAYYSARQLSICNSTAASVQVHKTDVKVISCTTARRLALVLKRFSHGYAPPRAALTNLAGFVEKSSDNVGADAPRLQRRLVVRGRVARGLAAQTPQLDHTQTHTHCNTYYIYSP